MAVAALAAAAAAARSAAVFAAAVAAPVADVVVAAVVEVFAAVEGWPFLGQYSGRWSWIQYLKAEIYLRNPCKPSYPSVVCLFDRYVGWLVIFS